MSRLDAVVSQAIADGGRLETRYPHHAVICYGAGNIAMHVTFAVLTVFTCGFFVFPWIVWANTLREYRVTIDVDPYGEVTRHR